MSDDPNVLDMEPEDAIGLDVFAGEAVEYDLGGPTKADAPPVQMGPLRTLAADPSIYLAIPAAYLAPSLVTLRNELNARWPNRDKRSDGWIGNAAHVATVSQHNPDSKGCVHAVDIDHDGIDQKLVLRELIGDPRVWYVIHDWTIWSRTYNWVARRYTGSNGHLGHIHCSIRLTVTAERDTRAWLPALPTEEYDMDTLDLRNADKVPVKGRHVDNLQGLLLASPFFADVKGSITSTGKLDGIAGKGTKAAVGKFQAHRGLPVDYVVGPKTWKKFIEY